MLTRMEVQLLESKIENISEKIMKLANNKKSFGSFFISYNNKEVMTYLPYFQQGIWGIPMNKEKTIFWEYHKDLSEIENYDFKLIFSFEESSNKDIVFKKFKMYKNAYEISIRTKIDDLGDLLLPFITKLMQKNPYL